MGKFIEVLFVLAIVVAIGFEMFIMMICGSFDGNASFWTMFWPALLILVDIYYTFKIIGKILSGSYDVNVIVNYIVQSRRNVISDSRIKKLLINQGGWKE